MCSLARVAQASDLQSVTTTLSTKVRADSSMNISWSSVASVPTAGEKGTRAQYSFFQPFDKPNILQNSLLFALTSACKQHRLYGV